MMAEHVTRLAQLRAGTRDAHARIETVPALARLLSNDLTRTNTFPYCNICMHFMPASNRRSQRNSRPFRPPRRCWMEPVPGRLPTTLPGSMRRAISPPYLTVPNDPVAALGALYVIEGSSMGARVIARHVTGSLGVSVGAGGSFYCHQDAETVRRRWHCLTALLEQPFSASASSHTDSDGGRENG